VKDSEKKFNVVEFFLLSRQILASREFCGIIKKLNVVEFFLFSRQILTLATREFCGIIYPCFSRYFSQNVTVVKAPQSFPEILVLAIKVVGTLYFRWVIT